MLFALSVQAATVTLNPVADAFVTTGPAGNLSGNNYGGAGALAIAAPGLANGKFQAAGDLVSLRLFAADNIVSYISNSRDYGTAAAHPVLSVVAVPEPGAVSLLAVGAALLFRPSRPKRSSRSRPAPSSS